MYSNGVTLKYSQFSQSDEKEIISSMDQEKTFFQAKFDIETDLSHLPNYFQMTCDGKTYVTDSNLVCPEGKCCQESDDTELKDCWCEIVDSLEKNMTKDGVKFLMRNLIDPTIHKAINFKCHRPDLDRPELKIVVDFYNGPSYQRKYTVLEFIDNDGKLCQLKSRKDLRDASFKFDCDTLPKKIKLVSGYTSIQTDDNLLCESIKTKIIDYIACPKNQFHWCLLIDQIQDKGFGQVKVPTYNGSSTYIGSNWLIVEAQRFSSEINGIEDQLHVQIHIHHDYQSGTYPGRYYLTEKKTT